MARETVFTKTLEDGRQNLVQLESSWGYGFTKSGRGTLKTKRQYIVFIGADSIYGCTQHGDLTRVFTSKAEAVRYAKQTSPAESENQDIVLVVHNATDADRSKVGIHLLGADQFEFQDAMETAQKDMFPAIYIHAPQHQFSIVKGA